MPDWSVVISGSPGNVTLDPEPQEVLSGDLVYWSNRTDASQTITIDGQTSVAPMVAPPWESSSPAYKASLPSGQTAPYSYTYTCKPSDGSGAGVKGTITIKSALTVVLLVVLGALCAPRLTAQAADCSAVIGGELREIPKIDDRDAAKLRVRGTLSTAGERQVIAFPKGNWNSGELNSTNLTCVTQWVRTYRKGDGTDANQGPKAPPTLPVPGPTIRARVGDIVELAFMNAIDPINFPGTDTKDANGNPKCDEAQNNTGQIYPQTAKIGDAYPNCFHASVFTNMHYHGAHTSPTSTADNVFLQIVPWARANNAQRTRTMPSDYNDELLKRDFDKFFADCEENLNFPDRPQQWPTVWDQLPQTYRDMQEALLTKFQPDLWKKNAEEIAANRFPQNYIGAFPYCFRLPVYKETTWPPKGPLVMGQAPGTHWYHAHKHGSTTINVSNGMTGLMIVEGAYDDEIKAWYDNKGGIAEKLIVLNQLNVSPRREGGNTPSPGPYFSVNGRLQPYIKMKPGEVQWWRIANSSSRSGLIFTPPTKGLQWRAMAIDGVQFANARYVESENKEFVLASGGRVDLLVMAPLDGSGTIPFTAIHTTDPLSNTSNPQLLFNVVIDTGHGTRNMGFMDRKDVHAPPFLKDITRDEVTSPEKTVRFATNRDPVGGVTPIFNRHTINGEQFHGEVGEHVALNKVEQWKIVNASYGGTKIAHPFHIHVNPFQIIEEFEPNALMSPVTKGPGQVTVTRSSNKLTGTNTTFLTTFRVGDLVKFTTTTTTSTGTTTTNVTANIISVDSDTSLTSSATASATVDEKPVDYTFGIPVYTTNKNAVDQHPGQCYIDPNQESSWHPCGPTEPPEGDGRKWWDTFSIPSGQTFYTKGGPAGGTNIPGYFTMRSRFVDYSGHFVLHCHILSHEDRGMMTGVFVGAEEKLPFSHH